MTREEARKMWPIIKAFSEGEVVEYRNNPNDEWFNLGGMNGLSFDSSPECYRIKPEPKYRPFNSVEECWQEMQKHQPFGWIKSGNAHYRIEYVKYKEGMKCHPVVGYHTGCLIEESMVSVSYHCTFADGTPFGVKEDGDE